MATDDDGDGDVGSTRRADLGDAARGALRTALTGTIFAMSVLAYLGDHDTGIVETVATVAGTGVVIFLAEAYAGLLSSALASRDPMSTTAIGREIGISSVSAAPGLSAGLFLVVAHALGVTVATGIDVVLWLGVLTLALCSITESVGSHRTLPVKILSIGTSVVLGVVIIVLKAALH